MVPCCLVGVITKQKHSPSCAKSGSAAHVRRTGLLFHQEMNTDAITLPDGCHCDAHCRTATAHHNLLNSSTLLA